MSRYEDGKAYRDDLRSRPRQTSTPEAREGAQFPHGNPPLPVTHRGRLGAIHTETVGWMDGKYHDSTRPNGDAHVVTDGVHTAPFDTLDRVKMKPTS